MLDTRELHTALLGQQYWISVVLQGFCNIYGTRTWQKVSINPCWLNGVIFSFVNEINELENIYNHIDELVSSLDPRLRRWTII